MSNQNRIFVQHKKVNLYKQIYEKKHRMIIVQALFCGEIRGGGAGTLSPVKNQAKFHALCETIKPTMRIADRFNEAISLPVTRKIVSWDPQDKAEGLDEKLNNTSMRLP